MYIYIYTHSISQVLKIHMWPEAVVLAMQPWTFTIISKMNRTIALNFESLRDDLVRLCVKVLSVLPNRLVFKCGLLFQIRVTVHCGT